MHTQTAQKSNILEQVRQLGYETPFFVTSSEVIKENYETFTSLFDNAEINYALKANADPRILSYLNSLESGFEAASYFEIASLLSVGVPPDRIVYGTSIKPASHIAAAHNSGVMRFAADSNEEIDKIAEHAPGAQVFVRTIVDDEGSVFTMSERFGTPANTVCDMLLYARDKGLRIYGISFYVGSQAANADKWAQGIRTVRPIFEQLLEHNIRIEALNIGGGFPVHYESAQDAPELREIVVKAHNALHELPYMPKVIMEPGRAIVATSTVLVSEIIARNDRAGKPWLCTDAGIYNALYEAMIHQGSTRYQVHAFVEQDSSVETTKFNIAGPTGDSLDIVARDVVLPANLGVGDRLIFEHAGAYSVTMASPFNGFPTPPLYLI